MEILMQAVSQGIFLGEREAAEDWEKKLSKDVVSALEEPDPMGSPGAQIVPQGWSCLGARCSALLVAA